MHLFIDYCHFSVPRVFKRDARQSRFAHGNERKLSSQPCWQVEALVSASARCSSG